MTPELWTRGVENVTGAHAAYVRLKSLTSPFVSLYYCLKDLVVFSVSGLIDEIAVDYLELTLVKELLNSYAP